MNYRPETKCVSCGQAWSYDTRFSTEYDIKICEPCGFGGNVIDHSCNVYVVKKFDRLLKLLRKAPKDDQ